jgi:hypothetical protein
MIGIRCPAESAIEFVVPGVIRTADPLDVALALEKEVPAMLAGIVEAL